MIWTRKRQLQLLLDELYAAYGRYQIAKQEVDDLCKEIAVACDVKVTALRLLIEERDPRTEREQQHLNELLELIADEEGRPSTS